MAKPKFPYSVKRGSAVVKIYFTPTKGCDSFTISFWAGGKRVRRTFSTFETAKFEAEKAANQLTTGDIDVLTLKSQDRAAYLRAKQNLEPIGAALETATAEYADAKKQLGDVPLARAVECYLQLHPRNLTPHPVKDVVAEFLAIKEADGLSAIYLKNLRHSFRRFAAGFNCNIADITGHDLDTWMCSLKIAARSRNNLRASLKTLFNFAKARKYVPKEHDELDAVAFARVPGGDIAIFEPEEMKTILAHAHPGLIPFLAIGAFAGIRNTQIQRLEWKDIRSEDGIIEIRAGKAKTASRRVVPLLDNLKAWLLRYEKNKGLIYKERPPDKEIHDLTESIRSSAEPESENSKFTWKRNALRHSFISYRVSATQNVAQVALEAGNSPQIIFSNYRELVSPKAAKAWFEIKPEV
ncbi:MAG: integrase [Limisphaerales bacterium]|jgi:integrase